MSQEEIYDVRSQPTKSYRNDRLLSYVERRGTDDYNTFQQVLENTGQHEIAFKLNSNLGQSLIALLLNYIGFNQ